MTINSVGMIKQVFVKHEQNMLPPNGTNRDIRNVVQLLRPLVKSALMNDKPNYERNLAQ